VAASKKEDKSYIDLFDYYRQNPGHVGTAAGARARDAFFEAGQSVKGATPTRGFAPVAIYGKGDAKSGFKFLENIATLGGGSKRLAGAIAGAKAGAGTINILQKNRRYAQYVHTPGAGDSISRRNQFSVPAYGGSYEIMPSQGTEESGHALTAMIQRAGDIHQRQYRKQRNAARSLAGRKRRR